MSGAWRVCKRLRRSRRDSSISHLGRTGRVGRKRQRYMDYRFPAQRPCQPKKRMVAWNIVEFGGLGYRGTTPGHIGSEAGQASFFETEHNPRNNAT